MSNFSVGSSIAQIHGTIGSASHSLSVQGNLLCKNLVISDQPVNALLKDIIYILPPGNLQLDNPSVVQSMQAWLNAIEALKVAYDELVVMNELAK